MPRLGGSGSHSGQVLMRGRGLRHPYASIRIYLIRACEPGFPRAIYRSAADLPQ